MAQQSSGGKASQAIAKKSPINELAQFLEGRRDEIQKVLPPTLSVERVIKTAIMAAMENEDIGQKCTAVSIYRSVMQASLMGLTVGSGFNEGYFIRYGNACTFRASYLGWAKVATRSPGVDMIRASVVYSNDVLDMSEQPPSVTHKPLWQGGKRGEVVGSLACAYTMRKKNDGATVHDLYDFTFVPLEDLKAAHNMNKSSPAWRSWPNEMRKKVAIRRLCKLLPRNDELGRLTRIENNADNGVVDVPDPEALPETDNLNEMIVDSRFEEAGETASATETELPDPEVIPPADDKKPAAKRKSRSSTLKGKMKGGADEQPPPPSDDDAPDYGGPPQGQVDF